MEEIEEEESISEGKEEEIIQTEGCISEGKEEEIIPKRREQKRMDSVVRDRRNDSKMKGIQEDGFSSEGTEEMIPK